jgi:hypothetical protein
VDLLASIIPGFRALRTPVAAGVLWTIDIVVFLISHHTHFHIDHSDITTVNALLPDWSGLVALPIILAASYLLGSVMMSLTGPILEKVVDLYRSVLTRAAVPYRKNEASRFREPGRYPWRKRFDKLARRSYLISINAHSLLYDYVISALTDAGAPGAAAMMFPVDHLHDKLVNCASQLSQVNPTQYQEYDRIQAEAEFRVAVIPPLIVTSCLAPISHRWALILAVAIGSLVLLVQSVSLNRTANEILAAATRVGDLKIPEIKSLSTYLASLDRQPTSDGEWIGAIIIGLNRRGFFEEADALIAESTELDQQSDVEELLRYLSALDNQTAEQFKREFHENRRIQVHEFKGTGAQ